MSDPKNLTATEAVEKIRELVKGSPTALFATHLTTLPIHACPMQAQQVDDAGDIWFFSGADSHHNAHIGSDHRVQLFFSNNSDYQFLTVYGEASISKERAKIDELWDTTVKAWFSDGKDDPNLTLIRVTPQDAHYWATKNGKVISLIQMVGAAVAGKVPDLGVHGDLKV